MITDLCYSLTDLHIFQFAASVKCIVPDLLYGSGDGDTGQQTASLKGALSDLPHALAKIHFFKLTAHKKCRRADPVHCCGNGDAFQ